MKEADEQYSRNIHSSGVNFLFIAALSVKSGMWQRENETNRITQKTRRIFVDDDGVVSLSSYLLILIRLSPLCIESV